MFEKNILITGGAGFIGSNFLPWFLERYPQYLVINLDKLTYAGNLDNLKECSDKINYRFIQGSIADKILIDRIFQEYAIDGVIHFAAESHVDNSIAHPSAFVDTNVVGTLTLLDAARRFWLLEPHKIRAGYESARFHHVSTDEVYGALGADGFFTEKTPYDPKSPYSASKAGSDMLVRSFFYTYGLNATISHCSNNYGPKQHSEKMIPKIIACCLQEKPIPVYGDGKNVRDWLYVLDHCRAIDLIFHQGKNGESYNVGGNNELSNLELVHVVCSTLDRLKPRHVGKYEELLTFVPDRPGHDHRYAIDASKIRGELGWLPEENFDSGILKTVDWYLQKEFCSGKNTAEKLV